MYRARTRASAPGHGTRCGVTLIEVVIAIFVLTMGILSIISLFPSGYRLSQAALDRSIAALAARDALARLAAESKTSGFSFPGTQTFCSVIQANRVGVIYDVNTSNLVCRVRGDETPSTSSASPYYWPNFGSYYFVLTSGSAAGSVFRIRSSSGSTLYFDTSGGHRVIFRTGGATGGVRARVGDHFAIIGSTNGDRCFPKNFLTAGGTDRTIEIATHGSDAPHEEVAANPPWEYSYGCIISAPSKDAQHLYQVDVFVYRRFQPAGDLEEQDRPVGHFVTYVSDLEDYANP